MAKILVTGGNGYIGSHTVVALQAGGHQVVIADNLCNSKPYIQERIASISGSSPRFYQLDLAQLHQVRHLAEQEGGFDGIIHFAAHLFVEESVLQPLKYYRNNLGATMNLLDVFGNEKQGVNIVFSSSCTVYGNPGQLPITEAEPIKEAVSPYGNTKIIGEQILRDHAVASGKCQVMALRYFNPIGAHESGSLGEDPIGHHTHLVPIITEVAKGKRPVLKVFGSDYPTRDGSCVRDYVHVCDLARAHVLALDYLAQGRNEQPFEAINIGSGTGYTVLEMAAAYERVTGLNVPYELAPRRPGDAGAVYADIRLAKDRLGWEPRLTLDDMLLSTYQWENTIP